VRRIVEGVDWPCRVIRYYADSNLGCAVRVSIGIKQIFTDVAECIFLEDDCLPSPSFFRYAEELLQRYRDDERIMHIDGCSYQFGQRRTLDSYYFSRFVCPWGWASWRRAWQHYDFGATLWPRYLAPLGIRSTQTTVMRSRSRRWPWRTSPRMLHSAGRPNGE
jgi:hypothetical protein